jgi:hypothetical protein
MERIGLSDMFFVAGFALSFLVLVIPLWQIFKKAGFGPWPSILIVSSAG